MSTRSKAAQDGEEKTSPKKKRGRPAKTKAVVEPTVTEKTEDEDTDVDESTAQVTASDGDKMETNAETKPQEESKTAVVSDKANSVKLTKDSETEKADADKKKSDDAEMTENKVEKADDDGKENKKDSADKDKAEENKDVVVIEDEEEEPEPEVEIIEDRDDGGEDPSEVEIEKFNMPVEHAVLSDLADMRCRRRLVVYPLKMSELSHPMLMEAVAKSTEFRTSYVMSRVEGTADTKTWVGYMELHLKSTILAADSMQSLKTIREDLTVRVLEPGENAQKLVQSAATEFADADTKLFGSIILARPLPDDATVATLKDVFPGATEIAFARQGLGARMAYIIYDDSSAVSAAFDKLSADPPSVGGRQLRLLKYDQNVDWPTGLLRLKRRYRVLLQMNRLRKAIKDPQNGRYMDTMKSTVSHCKSLIEKDDAVRKELGFDVPSFTDLRQYKTIRESVDEDAIWLPGKRMGGLLDRRSFVDEDEEDERWNRARSTLLHKHYIWQSDRLTAKVCRMTSRFCGRMFGKASSL